MHSNINHSYYTLLRPTNRPITTHHYANRSFYRTIRLSCTIKALPLLLHKTQLLKETHSFSFAYQGIDLICTTLSGLLVALFGAITLYVIDSFYFLDYCPFVLFIENATANCSKHITFN